jgi:dihydroxyacetone kinase-like protein
VALTTASALEWMRRFADEVAAHREELVALDTAIGDGDHGTNMDRGMRRALEQLDQADPATPGAVLRTVAMALISNVGGAAGPLYGTLLLQAASSLGEREQAGCSEVAQALRTGLDGVCARGKAKPGDKTMVDALAPAVEALERASALDAGLEQAARAAEQGMKATTPLIARRGRASYLGERSQGHQDPGATSAYYLIKSAAEALAD